MKLYAFDVDHTLEISAGPVQMQSIVDVRNEGHIVGICGNWAKVTMNFPEWWHRVFSFVGPMIDKAEFLVQLKRYIRADDYIMVGNDPADFPGRCKEPACGVDLGGVVTYCSQEHANNPPPPWVSNDVQAAQRAGWRFIREAEFAGGQR